MKVQIELLIAIIGVLVLLLSIAIVIICRYYVCQQRASKNYQYSKLDSPDPTKPAQIPKIPDFRSFQQTSNGLKKTPPFTMNEAEIASVTESTEQTFYADNNNHKPPLISYGHISKEHYTQVDGTNNSEIFHFDECQSVKSTDEAFSSEFEDASVSSDSHQSGKLTKKTRIRFKSEPILNRERSTSSTDKQYKLRSMSASKFNVAAATVCSPAKGCIEFSLFYDSNRKDLTVTIIQLHEIAMNPEIFVGVLDVFNKTEQQQWQHVHLVRNSNDSLRLSDDDVATGFLAYVTLLPKKRSSRHTDTVFGKGNIAFNEKFVFSGYTIEQLSQRFICVHVLCKFERDGEPIVLGEVKVPLKRLHTSQVLPFMANLSQAEEELVLTNYLKPITDLGFLEIYLSFNPMAQILIVKVIQANDLPKLGMTGNPNVSVKISLYYCNVRVSKKTTSIQKRQKSPVFNELFNFQLSKDRISECDMLFEVRHHGAMYRNPIGYVIVGNSAGGEGTKQWRQLLNFSYHEQVYKIMPNRPVGLK